MSSVDCGVGPQPGAAAGIDTDEGAVALVHEPEVEAAEHGHVRVDHGDGGKGREHRLERSEAFAKNTEAGIGSEMKGRGHEAARGQRRQKNQQTLAGATTRTTNRQPREETKG